MLNSSERVKKWRKETKDRMVEAMGGSCQSCGYKGCSSVYDFHHLDPNEKEFGFGKIRANCKSWDKIVEELKKCVLLCSNCHREIHSGYRELPKNYFIFNEKFAKYKDIEKMSKQNLCPICNKLKSIDKITCSAICSAKNKYNWENIDIEKMLNEGHTFMSISEIVGCSDTAVRKRYNKIKTAKKVIL